MVRMETKQNRAANKTMVMITYKLTPQMQSLMETTFRFFAGTSKGARQPT